MNVNNSYTRGTVFSIYNLADDLGRGFGPFIIGSFLIYFFGRNMAFNIANGFWLICGVFILMMVKTFPSENNKERNVISGEVKQLDAIAIIEDKSPPLILSTHPGNNGKYPSLELNQFKIMIDDKLSGFDPNESSFDLLLDNVPLIYTYQPKLKIISFDLRRPLSIGNHTMQIIIRDQAGNKTNKSIGFSVY